MFQSPKDTVETLLEWTYHLVAKEDFPMPAELYTPQAFSKDGFVHTTRRREHLHEVANRYYRSDLRPYWVLTLEMKAFGGPWRYDLPNDEYPHLYAPIPARAIARIEEAPRTSDGEFLPLR